MWTYHQATGRLLHNGKPLATGYSGNGAGKNNPAMEGVRGVGPIPKGRYRIGKPYDSANTGPFTIPLYAIDEKPNDDIHQRTKRSAFRLHGDSRSKPGTASNGCIIQNRDIRVLVDRARIDGDDTLEVVE